MGFLMDGLDAEAYDRTYTDGQLVRRILGYVRPQARKILAASGAVVLTASLGTGLPIVISRGLDQLQTGASFQTMLTLAGLLTVLASMSWVINAVRQTLASQAVGDVVLKLREDAVDAILKRDMSFYDQFASGKIVSRVTSDTQSFAQVMTLTMELLSQILLLVLFLFLHFIKIINIK